MAKGTALQVRPLAVTKALDTESRLKLFKKAVIDVKAALVHETKNYEQDAQATVHATQLKNSIKAIEENRKQANKEPQEFINANNSQCKPFLAKLGEALDYINAGRRAFQRSEDKKKEEEEAKARTEAERRQKISIAQGGDGSNIKPIEQPIDNYKLKSTSKGRRIPDYEAIQRVIDKSAEKMNIPRPCEIAGVEIYPVWKFTIIDSAAVPDDLKKTSYVDG